MCDSIVRFLRNLVAFLYEGSDNDADADNDCAADNDDVVVVLV